MFMLAEGEICTALDLETAHRELKALRTRQAVLRGNLMKLQSAEPS
jgi:hypothetical protein